MQKFITIILILISLFSCRGFDNWGFSQPITMSTVTPDGPPEYKAGWYGGCKSGLAGRHHSAFANAWSYQENKGPEFGSGIYAHDPMYQMGWGQGWFACAVHSTIFTNMYDSEPYPLE